MERRKEEIRAAPDRRGRARPTSTHGIQVEQPIDRPAAMPSCATLRVRGDAAAARHRRAARHAGELLLVYRQPVGRVRHDPHLELPRLRRRAEARARARHRLHDGLQAVAVRTAHQPVAGRDHRRGRPAAGRRQLGDGPVGGDRQALVRGSAHRQGELHGQRRHRQDDHGRRVEDAEARAPRARRQVGRASTSTPTTSTDAGDDGLRAGHVPRRPGLRDVDPRPGAGATSTTSSCRRWPASCRAW